MSEASVKLYNETLDAAQTGQLETALSTIERALVEDPGDTESWHLYTKLLAAAGRSEDAAKATEKLKSLGLGAADEILLKAAKQLATGDLQGAITSYTSAAETDPENPDIPASLAMALFQHGDKSAALAAAEKAVELAPGDSRANYALGHILRLEGEKDKALEILTRALEAEPDFMPALYEQGMLLADCDRLEEALANFETFSKANPQDNNAAQAIERIKTALNRTRTY